MNEIINLGNGAFIKVTMLKGQQGDNIASITKTSTEGLVDTYTITLTDGSTHTFTVTNGKGIVSITKTATVGLVDTYTITFSDSTTQTFDVTNGNGIASIAITSSAGLVDTYTITFTNGNTTTFDVTNGANGTDGVGITSIAKTSTSGLVDTYTITFTNGATTTFDVTNGANGQDVANSNLAPVETGNTASKSYVVGEHLIWNGIYYVVTQAIAIGGSFVVGTNLQQDSVSSEIESLNKKRITLISQSGETYAQFFKRVDQARQNAGLSLSGIFLIFKGYVFTFQSAGTFYRTHFSDRGNTSVRIRHEAIYLYNAYSWQASVAYTVNSNGSISDFSSTGDGTSSVGAGATCIICEI